MPRTEDLISRWNLVLGFRSVVDDKDDIGRIFVLKSLFKVQRNIVSTTFAKKPKDRISIFSKQIGVLQI
jgi:hypothetical protein